MSRVRFEKQEKNVEAPFLVFGDHARVFTARSYTPSISVGVVMGRRAHRRIVLAADRVASPPGREAWPTRHGIRRGVGGPWHARGSTLEAAGVPPQWYRVRGARGCQHTAQIRCTIRFLRGAVEVTAHGDDELRKYVDRSAARFRRSSRCTRTFLVAGDAGAFYSAGSRPCTFLAFGVSARGSTSAAPRGSNPRQFLRADTQSRSVAWATAPPPRSTDFPLLL